MAQGWTINATADQITFYEAPPTGTNNIVVKEFATGGIGGTDAWALGAWSGYYGYPSEVEFYSDRLFWAGSPLDPQSVWGSQTGDYTNHGRSTPIVDSDAVSFTINARQVNAIMDLVPLDKLIVLSKGGEFLMTGGQDEVIAPSTINIKPQSFRGSGGLQAKVVGETAIFVQEQGQHVYDIGYRFESDGYRPQNLSVWASHLVEAHEILRMEWAPAPWTCLWFVRDDGVALGCTYMPEQEVIGWHRHDTGRTLDDANGVDEIEDIVCLPGDQQTEVIVLVKRVVNGQTVRYIEQMAPEFVSDIRDWKYCDSCLTYDGRNATGTTLIITGDSFTENSDLTVIASAPLFVGASDEADGLFLRVGIETADPVTGGTTVVHHSVRLVIIEYVSATQVIAQSVGDVPDALQGTPTSDWVFMRDTISGLDHLEGREVAILSDGSVHPKRIVTGGALTLDAPGGVVTVGLPYRAHIETLELNSFGGPPMRDSKKLLTAVGLLVQDSRGIKVCGGELREDYIYELPQREFENYGDPTMPLTGYGEVPVSAEWGENLGHFHVLSDDPLPMTILAFIPKFLASDRVG